MFSQIARRFYRRYLREFVLRRWHRKGADYAAAWVTGPGHDSSPDPSAEPSPLEDFFNRRVAGRGIWKWRHYFEIYHRHLNPLRHRERLVILEIGIYSGGSLDMWRDYFGPSARIYGVDIEPACKAYEQTNMVVLIGDQADRTFWRRALADGTLPPPDIVIDDGGHTPEQQRITLEELLPHMSPGGVYVCEDIHGQGNAFAAFVAGLADALHGMEIIHQGGTDPERRMAVPTNGIQSTIHSVHLYPYVVVIEKRDRPLPELVAPKHGTEWEPFLG